MMALPKAAHVENALMEKQKHHVKSQYCTTRPKYREGRSLKSVKVYTINDESKYLLIQGIPTVDADEELIKLLSLNGDIEEHRLLKGYPSEDFSHTLLVKFKRIQSARFAKRKVDDMNFYGGVLHICYAPEYESVQETREKLVDRKRGVAFRVKKLDAENIEIQQKLHESLKNITGETEEVVDEEKNSAVRVIDDDRHVEYAKDEISHQYHTHVDSHRHEYWFPTESQSQHSESVQNNRIPHYPPYNHFPEPNISGPGCFPHQSLAPPPRAWYPPDYDGRLHVSSPSVEVVNQSLGKNNKDSIPQVPKDTAEADDAKNINVDKGGKCVVKKLDSKLKIGKLVPRQVLKKKVLPDGLLGKVTETTRDSVNEELRKNAFILGGIKGPSKSEYKEAVAFQKSLTGDAAMDNTTLKIRQKVKQFAAVAPPPQLRKKRKVTNV